MNLLRKSQMDVAKTAEYATSEDFARLFTADMRRLYLLSFLLTANQERAEQSFVGGLEDSVKGNPVFREWARSWAERTVIKNAIRIMAPRPSRDSESFQADRSRENIQDQHHALASVLALEDFDRFVFVMSVLERYTEKECSVLLGCSRQDVREARIRALRQIAEYLKPDAAAQQELIRPSDRSLEMLVP